jgi:HTH-type transcriptional regulator / antitoxin HigA
MPEKTTFKPDWISRPGDTIADILESQGCSAEEFAQRMGCTLNFVSDLLAGRVTISPETALKLELVLGGTADFWMIREAQYSGAVAPHQGDLQSKRPAEWLNELPLRDMRRFGWLDPKLSKIDPVTACLRFFGVVSVEAFRATYRSVLEKAAFRISPTLTSKPGAVAAWLRKGEIEGASIDCRPWNDKLLQKTLLGIRSLTRKRDPKLFLPELTRLCSECGVAVVIVRAPEGCRASGATRFLSPSKALLVLSFRYLSDDHFWFSFFHEAGHLLLHGKKALFLEGGQMSSAEEEEANEFAGFTLVPPEYQQTLRCLAIDRHAIRDFAKAIGVSPGVVLGQLQNLGRARRNQLNMLKVHFQWDQSEG